MARQGRIRLNSCFGVLDPICQHESLTEIVSNPARLQDSWFVNHPKRVGRGLVCDVDSVNRISTFLRDITPCVLAHRNDPDRASQRRLRLPAQIQHERNLPRLPTKAAQVL